MNNCEHFMAWLAVAPEIKLPTIDVQPVAALVQEAPAHGAVEQFKAISGEFETTVERRRLALRQTTSGVIGRLTTCGLDGWSVDCSRLLATIEEGLSTSEDLRKKLEASVRGFVKAVIHLRLPGANVANQYGQKVIRVVGAWSSDLDDFRDQVNLIQKTMLANGPDAPIAKALAAYSAAIESVTGVKPLVAACINPEDFEATAFVNLPVPNEIRSDRTKKRDYTNRVHQIVSEIDSSLVGLVAIRYEQLTSPS